MYVQYGRDWQGANIERNVADIWLMYDFQLTDIWLTLLLGLLSVKMTAKEAIDMAWLLFLFKGFWHPLHACVPKGKQKFIFYIL